MLSQNGKWENALTCKRASCIPPTTTTTTTTVKMFVPCPAQGQQGSDDCPAGCEHVTNCAECALAAKVWASKGFSYSNSPFKAGDVGRLVVSAIARIWSSATRITQKAVRKANGPFVRRSNDPFQRTEKGTLASPDRPGRSQRNRTVTS